MACLRWVIALVGCMSAVAFAAPKDLEPSAVVTTKLASITKNIEVATGRTTVVALGEGGSSLSIATDTKFIGPAFEITIGYAADPRGKNDALVGAATGHVLAKVIARATKLKADGFGNAGSLTVVVTGDTDEEMVALLPKLLKALDKGAVTGTDLADALAVLERRTSARLTIPGDVGLTKLLYSNPPTAFTLDTAGTVKAIKSVKAAAIADTRKRIRAGYVRIAITGTFSASEIKTLEKAVRTGLAGWKLRGPLVVEPSKPVPRAARTERYEKTGFSSPILAMGQVVQAPDDATALAFDLACSHEGPLRTRISAAVTQRVRVSCERDGRQFHVAVNIVAEDKLEDHATTVKAAITKLVADGPTMAEHAKAQEQSLSALDPLQAGGNGPQTGVLNERSLSDRAAAATAIAAVKRADVKAALALLDPTTFVTTIATP